MKLWSCPVEKMQMFFGKRRRHHTDDIVGTSNNFDEAFHHGTTRVCAVANMVMDVFIAMWKMQTHLSLNLVSCASDARLELWLLTFQVGKLKCSTIELQNELMFMREGNSVGSYARICGIPSAELKDTISFKHILVTFPVNCRAAVPEDISPHLCFICLLHLANEYGLSIHDCPSLDDLSIHLPSRLNSDGVEQPSS
ncbi:condensin complex subunit 2-like [Prunus yedoensis var. nudiflora]|uniref:Condensin complex subunit 2-like n=1 Tax=Prunus yedoensis var. nudiflora TaxID=2094558 RepID=A0A314XM88_PRUYE|nr:condensin complex subunit 2-like [Prunus yedoensis var. nudiflora]